MNWGQDKAFESKMRVKTIMNDMSSRPTEKVTSFPLINAGQLKGPDRY